jgi:5-methylcytosine-specific restriction enzyme A
MTDRAPRLMSCGCVVPYGERCQHYREQRAIADARRPNARARGYDTKWHKASADFLKLPGNERCACGCWRAADMVDHRIAPKGNMKLFWDRTNWQPYALICNTRKAIKHEGGFGRSPMAPSETLATPPGTARGSPRETSGQNISPGLAQKPTEPRFY